MPQTRRQSGLEFNPAKSITFFRGFFDTLTKSILPSYSVAFFHCLTDQSIFDALNFNAGLTFFTRGSRRSFFCHAFVNLFFSRSVTRTRLSVSRPQLARMALTSPSRNIGATNRVEIRFDSQTKKV